MAEEGKTDTFKITEGYLKDFAGKKLQGFVDTRDENHSVQGILQYVPVGGTVQSGTTDVYAVVKPGHPGVISEVAVLQTAHDTLSKNLQLAVRGLYRIALKMQDDLLEVDEILGRGESDAELTALEMVAVIGDIWKPTGSTEFKVTDIPGFEAK